VVVYARTPDGQTHSSHFIIKIDWPVSFVLVPNLNAPYFVSDPPLKIEGMENQFQEYTFPSFTDDDGDDVVFNIKLSSGGSIPSFFNK